MKKHLLNFALIILLMVSVVCSSKAQTITTVTNPNAPDLFAWMGAGGVLSGYAGNPVMLNNTLVLEYNAGGTSDPTQAVIQLAVYNGGDSLHLIPNPDAGLGVYNQSVQVVFNNKLFFIYLPSTGGQRLASFDGTSITVYPNPDASTSGYIGSPRILNNSLYVAYQNVSGVTQYGVFNGSGITLIPNPDNSTVGFYNDYSVVFNNKIVSRYVTAAGPKQLATYDGTSWSLVPNPDNTPNHGFQPIFPQVYHSKLYWIYYGVGSQYQFAIYDGTNPPTLMANPQNSSTNGGGVSGFPIVANDTLFFQYYSLANVSQLAKSDGSTISLVPNPDATTYGFWNVPIVYNSNLYIFYVTVDGNHHLTQYQPQTNSLKVYPNPDGGLGYWDKPIVYANKLFFQYYNAQSVFQLGYFAGDSIKLLPNPAGIYNGAAGNNGYFANPIIFNNLLFMQMASVPYGNAGSLAYIDGSTLPVSLTSFTAEKAGKTSLLKWNVASEVNNAYFEVEHAIDGVSFLPIGKVAGHGTISIQQQYQFIDQHPVGGVNFYRLKQVDYDGHFTYSSIATVNFDHLVSSFGVAPNPAIGTVNLTIPASSLSSFIDVFDGNGKKVLTKQLGPNSISQPLNVGGLAPGIYQFVCTQGTQRQLVKVVKK